MITEGPGDYDEIATETKECPHCGSWDTAEDEHGLLCMSCWETVKAIPLWQDTLVNAAEFLKKDIPPRKLLLDPWLSEDGIVLIAAWRGIGKSLFVHEVAAAVATGKELFGWKPPMLMTDDGVPITEDVGNKVLIIDGELPQSDMQRRLSMTGERYPGAMDNITLYLASLYWTTNGPPLNIADPTHHEAIMRMSQGHKVVIFDNISSLSSSEYSESDDQSWGHVSTLLNRLRSMGVASILVHHTGKGGTQRGTSKREDLNDAGILLERDHDWSDEDEPEFKLTFNKCRGFSQAKGLILKPKFSHDEDKRLIDWDWCEAGSKRERLVDEMVTEGLSSGEIAKELNISKRQVNRLKKKLGL